MEKPTTIISVKHLLLSDDAQCSLTLQTEKRSNSTGVIVTGGFRLQKDGSSTLAFSMPETFTRTPTDDELKNSFLGLLRNERNVFFFKHVVRKPEFMKAYLDGDLEFFKDKAPEFYYAAHFIRIYSKAALNTEWDPIPKYALDKNSQPVLRATTLSRQSVAGVELLVRTQLRYTCLTNPDLPAITASYSFNPLGTDVVQRRQRLEFAVTQNEWDWMTARSLMRLPQYRDVVIAWLRNIPGLEINNVAQEARGTSASLNTPATAQLQAQRETTAREFRAMKLMRSELKKQINKNK